MDNKRQMEKSALTHSKINRQLVLPPLIFKPQRRYDAKKDENTGMYSKVPLRLCVFEVHSCNALKSRSAANLKSSI
jgi:hypothetical protein